MKCDEIIKKLESLSPASFAEEWDNVGLLAGRRDKEVSTVYIALDATDEVIKEAVRLGADLLLTHHPLIFKKMGRITTEDFIGRRLVELLRNDISYYAMHTNFDVMGMAEAAADYLELQDRQVLNVTYEKVLDKKVLDAETPSREGFGRVGRLGKSMTVAEFAAFVKLRFDVPNVRVYGSLEDIVELAAVMPGSGGSFICDVINAGAKVMVTGDIGHHEGIDAVAQGLTIIDAGHYGIEKLFIAYMEKFIKRELPGLTVCAAEIKEPFVVV